MKAPLSWIREYVDVPAGRHHRRAHRPADPHRAQARGHREPRRATSPARSWSGACSPWSRAAEERQDHQLVHRRRRSDAERPRTGEQPGASSAAPTTSRPATWSWRSLPGGVLPGGFEIAARKTYGHLSDRDDLLGPRARARRGPRRHHRAAADAGHARRGRAPAARARRGDHRVRDQPRPRLRAVDARASPARCWSRSTARAASATRPCATPRRRRRRATRSWSRTPRAARSSWPAR